MGNWTPIRLFNTDIKIDSSAIANRIKSTLPAFISFTENGFRFIGENTLILYDLMHNLEEHNKTGLSILVDFVKAFGFIEWELLIRPSTSNWFPSFYFKPKGCVINNGNMSHFFSLGRSCRQRDPLSPIFLLLVWNC